MSVLKLGLKQRLIYYFRVILNIIILIIYSFLLTLKLMWETREEEIKGLRLKTKINTNIEIHLRNEDGKKFIQAFSGPLVHKEIVSPAEGQPLPIALNKVISSLHQMNPANFSAFRSRADNLYVISPNIWILGILVTKIKGISLLEVTPLVTEETSYAFNRRIKYIWTPKYFK